jgi:hypothetical protein
VPPSAKRTISTLERTLTLAGTLPVWLVTVTVDPLITIA